MKQIIIDPQHGLCNRLRAIGSAYSIAKECGYKLFIYWTRDEHMDCDLKEIIENIGEIATLIDTLNLENYKIYNYMTIENGTQEDIILDSDLIYCKSNTRLNHQYNFKFMREFMNSIRYTSDVYELINSIDASKCIGLHIRTVDVSSSYDKSDQNWTKAEHDLMNYHREGSNCQQFINQINHSLFKNPDATFFVCSNEEKVIKRLIQIYGIDKIRTLNRKSYDRSLDNIIHAVADMLLLSTCESFFGSWWSSFSEVVCMLRKSYNSSYSNEFPKNKDIMKTFEKQNIDGEVIQCGNTILTACMNRFDNLMVSLKSWLELNNVNEIVIVDWGSTIPVKIDIDSKKVKIFRVDNVDKWCLTKAYNFGIKCCSFTNIYKFDCETIITNKNLINYYPLNNYIYYRGDWKTVKDENDMQINGTLFCSRENLIKNNGYNENITTYGWDDDDMYARLSAFLVKKHINAFGFRFINHDDESRESNVDKGWTKTHSTQFNRILIKDNILTWNRKCIQSTYEKVKPNVYILNSNFNIDYKIIKDNFTETIKFVNKHYSF